jgi:hypothetical protein
MGTANFRSQFLLCDYASRHSRHERIQYGVLFCVLLAGRRYHLTLCDCTSEPHCCALILQTDDCFLFEFTEYDNEFFVEIVFLAVYF